MLRVLKEILTNPNLFNYILMLLYTLSATRWMFAGDLLQMLYWIGALLLTIGVTFR